MSEVVKRLHRLRAHTSATAFGNQSLRVGFVQIDIPAVVVRVYIHIKFPQNSATNLFEDPRRQRWRNTLSSSDDRATLENFLIVSFILTIDDFHPLNTFRISF